VIDADRASVDLEPVDRRALTRGPWRYVRLMRPRQWVKNLLVLAAPAAAGVLDQSEYLARSLLVLVCFCLAASGTYCLNDAADAAADRVHPTKRFRPVASGLVHPGRARALGVVLIGLALGLGLLAGEWAISAITALYVLLTTAYTYWLKHVVVVDMVLVASLFVVRAVSGVVGTDIPISDWYLIVTSFGALLLVAGKRTTELKADDAVAHRAALADYTPGFLLYVRSMASGVTLLSYCLWAFEKAELTTSDIPWFQLSIVPLVLVILRYALLLETEAQRGPEEILLSDRGLQVLVVGWGILFAAGVYLGDAPPLN